MNPNHTPSQLLAARITKKASKQTYYTIRFFVDRELVPDAYRAYGYFRWVDDVLDAPSGSLSEKMTFIDRQKSILETCYQGQNPQDVGIQEQMLVDLIQNDSEANSGLQVYLRSMMGVMNFDTRRRGSFISQVELMEYTRLLAKAVTEALHFFIGQKTPAVPQDGRYLAVTAAHIIHMLRDTREDIQVGYFNIPMEIVQRNDFPIQDVENQATRNWVRSRVELARQYFDAGRKVLGKDRCLRRRVAGFAYMARFEWLIQTFQKDDYCLRYEYPERKSLQAGLWMGWRLLESLLAFPWIKVGSNSPEIQSLRMNRQ